MDTHSETLDGRVKGPVLMVAPAPARGRARRRCIAYLAARRRGRGAGRERLPGAAHRGDGRSALDAGRRDAGRRGDRTRLHPGGTRRAHRQPGRPGRLHGGAAARRVDRRLPVLDDADLPRRRGRAAGGVAERGPHAAPARGRSGRTALRLVGRGGGVGTGVGPRPAELLGRVAGRRGSAGGGRRGGAQHRAGPSDGRAVRPVVRRTRDARTRRRCRPGGRRARVAAGWS